MHSLKLLQTNGYRIFKQQQQRYCTRPFNPSSYATYSPIITTRRKSSNYKRRPQLNTVSRDQLDNIKSSYFENRTSLNTDEWTEVRQALINGYKHINSHNIDAVILGLCSAPEHLPLAKNYVKDLHECSIQPNAATLGRLLRVYNAVYHNKGGQCDALTQQEQNEIIEIYEQLKEKYEILDATSCENLIYGLVATARWREAEQLLEMMKSTGTPTVAAYTELSIKAFTQSDMKLGWCLLEDMLALRKNPKCEIFLAYLQLIAKPAYVKDFQYNFEKLLLFIEKYDLTITTKVVNGIEKAIDEAKRTTGNAVNIDMAVTQLDSLGKCHNCAQHLQHVAINDEEFQRLSDSFLKKVLIRNDVFQKSTPEEVERFMRFIGQTAPFDCVIDGLNVAYSMGSKQTPNVLANLLASVVKYFNNRNKHVLVLGRKHMNNWPKDAMQYVRKNAQIFLTNNLSHDDPFLLYATLKSGPSTDFFSRDLMRAHAFLLGPELKSIFRRWQQEHQYSLVTQMGSGKIVVKEPIRYRISAHKVQMKTSNNQKAVEPSIGDYIWHLPCKEEYSANPSENFEIPKQWLCIKIKN